MADPAATPMERFSREFPKGHVLFREGEPGKEMFVVQSGKVRIAKNVRDVAFAASPDLIVWHGLSRWSRPEGELFPGLIAPALIAVAIVIAASKFRTIGASAAWRRSSPNTCGNFAPRKLSKTGYIFVSEK